MLCCVVCVINEKQLRSNTAQHQNNSKSFSVWMSPRCLFSCRSTLTSTSSTHVLSKITSHDISNTERLCLDNITGLYLSLIEYRHLYQHILRKEDLKETLHTFHTMHLHCNLYYIRFSCNTTTSQAAKW